MRIEDFVLGLARKLPGDWNEIFMDNLFTSASVLKTLRAMKKHATGTMRAAGRGYTPELAIYAQQWEKAPPPKGSYYQLKFGANKSNGTNFDCRFFV